MNQLSPVQQKFILHWGEMGTRWGINRTVAQVHALLFISPKPLNAEDLLRQPGEILVGDLIGTPDPHDNGFPLQAVRMR